VDTLYIIKLCSDSCCNVHLVIYQDLSCFIEFIDPQISKTSFFVAEYLSEISIFCHILTTFPSIENSELDLESCLIRTLLGF